MDALAVRGRTGAGAPRTAALPGVGIGALWLNEELLPRLTGRETLTFWRCIAGGNSRMVQVLDANGPRLCRRADHRRDRCLAPASLLTNCAARVACSNWNVHWVINKSHFLSVPRKAVICSTPEDMSAFFVGAVWMLERIRCPDTVIPLI
jgi:hypothetical protein